jgi:hypothetical protein
MVFNKKAIVFAIILFFTVSVSASAFSSGSFLDSAQKYIDNHCSDKKISNEESLHCFLFYSIQNINHVLSYHSVEIKNLQNQNASLSAQLVSLQERVASLETTPTATPTNIPMPTPTTTQSITVSNGTIFTAPSGFKSMSITLFNTNGLPAWAPTVSFDNGNTFNEQIRFSGLTTSVTIPILSNTYRLNSGGSNGFTAHVVFNIESNAQVILLGQSVNYPFTSNPFNSDSFSSVTITVGPGDNPQHVTGLSLQRFDGGSYIETNRINCDGGAQCPMPTFPLLGGTYRVVLEGSGANAILGGILRQ